jgi:branched-chain amino acid transport system permease protein
VTRSGRLGLLALAVFLVVLPLPLTPNLINAAIKMMIAGLFALSFSLAMGQAGMLSFGHSAYYGLGAFATLHLMKAVEGHLVAWPTPVRRSACSSASCSAGWPRNGRASTSRW